MSRAELIEAFNRQIPRFSIAIADQIIQDRLESYAGFPHDQLVVMARNALEAFAQDIASGQATAFIAHWERIGRSRAEQGTRLEDLLRGLFLSETIMTDFVVEQWGHDQSLQIWWLTRMHSIITAGVSALARIFNAVREQIIQQQAAQITELSTPIIPIHEEILALPLVGSIDSRRSAQILETLLMGVTKHQAEVVIMDITGVPLVDTATANYLLQATRAAHLLGAQVVLVGISAEIAQTITHLGADVSLLTIRSDMQSGLAYALERQGWRLSQRGAASPAGALGG